VSVTPIRVAIAGARGRMGTEAVKAVSGAEDMVLVATLTRDDNITETLKSAKPDVLVELTTPESVMTNIRAALQQRVTPIVGTTGITDDDLEEIRTLCAAQETGCLIAPNFALGAVLLMQFAATAARYLPDVEIIEMHHERKKDAPSGTAARTAEMIAVAREGTPIAPPADAFESCAGARGGRAAGDIPIHSIRLPGFVASQEVIFGGQGQRLSLRHDSIDRLSFMPGTLLAIRRASALQGLVIGLENIL